MRQRYRSPCIAAVLLIAVAAVAAGFTPTPEPINAGRRAIVDLPTDQHIKNVGGSDGAGLCVFTSVEHAARWQNVPALDGFQRWMTRRPGGGWPEKLDDMIAAYTKEKGVKVPPYIQHTGGDAAFLELALKTDRMPCVTYAGRDDFYRGRIAHMVNLAHLDSESAAIIDNNRPGVWVWMTRAEFLARWRDMQGGWAVVLLAPPPPPHNVSSQIRVEQCPGGECPTPAPVVATATKIDLAGSTPIGVPPSERHEWGVIPSHGWGWRLKADPQVAAPVPVQADKPENYGVDMSRIHAAPSYSINGVEVTRPVALQALAGGSPLADDSDRWHLTAVGDTAFLARVSADVSALSDLTRSKLLFQAYTTDRWEVGAFGLPAGVCLRKPSAVRTAPDVGCIQVGSYTTANLAALLSSPGGPVKADPVPPSPPTPAPVPSQPDSPTPTPAPDTAGGSVLWAVLVAVVTLIASLFRRK
jgi:hypothetical protein